MTHDEAFLADILERPEDDSPRLVYADWLDDQGEGARAEFIRVQIERERLERQKSREARRQARQLRHRERQLLAKHRQAWLGGLLGFVERYRFRRGFLDMLRLSGPQLLTHGGLLAGFPTAQTISLSWWGGGGEPTLRDLLACPHLAWVTHLRLTFLGLLDPGDVPEVQDLPRLPRLRVLDLAANALGPGEAALLASATVLPSLVEMELSENEIGDPGAEALARSPHFPRLARLDLRRNRITDAGAEALAASPHLRALRDLDLRGNYIFGHGAQALRARFGDAVDLREQSSDLGDIPF